MGITDRVPSIDIDVKKWENSDECKKGVTKFLDDADVFLAPFFVDQIVEDIFKKNLDKKTSLLYAFLLYLYDSSKRIWNAELVWYTKKFIDCMYENKPIMVSYVKTEANIVPKNKARVAFEKIGKYVSMKYNRDLCVINNCEYYLPQNENLFGTIEYYSQKEYINFINNIEKNFNWDKII